MNLGHFPKRSLTCCMDLEYCLFCQPKRSHLSCFVLGAPIWPVSSQWYWDSMQARIEVNRRFGKPLYIIFLRMALSVYTIRLRRCQPNQQYKFQPKMNRRKQLLQILLPEPAGCYLYMLPVLKLYSSALIHKANVSMRRVFLHRDTGMNLSLQRY